jgi:hypothetical protein
MIKRVFVLCVVLGLVSGFFVSVREGGAVTYTVGVEAGRWAAYSVLGGWDVQPANASVLMPQAIQDARNTEFINMSVESVSQKTVTLVRTTYFRNATKIVALISGNVETGAGTLNLTVVSRGLEVGDRVTNSPAAVKILLGEPKTYAGAERSVNYANSTENIISGTRGYEFHWDKDTGIMVAMLFFQEDRSSEYAALSSIVISMTATNMWEPEGFNPFRFVQRYGSEIVFAGVFVIAAVLTVYAISRRPKKTRGRRH